MHVCFILPIMLSMFRQPNSASGFTLTLDHTIQTIQTWMWFNLYLLPPEWPCRTYHMSCNKTLTALLYLLCCIPVVCRPLLHQKETTNHHRQCPRSHSSTPPHALHRWLSHQPAWCLRSGMSLQREQKEWYVNQKRQKLVCMCCYITSCRPIL